MELSKYKNKYVKLINNYVNNKDLYKDHFIYEVLYALKLDLILWSDIPSNFNEKFNIPHKRDYGVDLINLSFNQTCQVKHYGPKSTITWTDFTNFTGYSKSIIKTDNMILATTPEAKIDSLVNCVLRDEPNIKLIRHKFDDLLNEIEIPKIEQIEEIKETKIKIKKRKYLIDCYNLVNESNKKSLKLQLPCGTGKTYIMLYIIREFLKTDPNGKFVIFSPWIDLANQTFKLFSRSDIKTYLIGDGNTKYDDDFHVIICVNPSNKYIANETFNYKFIDEAHHLESDKSVNRKLINNIKCDKEINLSATFNEQDNLDYNYPMDQAIEDGYITDYVINVEYFSNGDNKMEALAKLIKDNMSWAPMFVYFNSTEKCMQFKKLLGNSYAQYLIGKDKKDKRKRVHDGIIDGSVKVLCLCGVYNEGISIDNLQTVIFGDLRHSQINKIQIAMRANRLHDAKPFYRVVLPVIESDFVGKDIKSLIGSFCKIDSRVKNAIEKRGGGRININLHVDYMKNKYDYVDGDCDEYDEELINRYYEECEWLYEEVYDRFGTMINGLSEDDKMELLFEYADRHEGAPGQTKSNDDMYGLGVWFKGKKGGIKSEKDKMYIKLSKNEWIKKSLDKNLKYKREHSDKVRLTEKQTIEMLHEYFKDHNDIPGGDDIFESKIYGCCTIGKSYTNIKSRMKTKNKVYDELKTNTIMKNNLDELFEYREQNKDKKPMKDDYWIDLLLDYAEIHDNYPINKRKHKKRSLGDWYARTRRNLTSEDDELYKRTMHIKKIKDNLDMVFDKPDDQVVKIGTPIEALLKYAKNIEKAPTRRTEFDGHKIGVFLSQQKSNIYLGKDKEMYNILSKNQLIKDSIDKYINDKNEEGTKETTTTEQWTKLLFKFVDEQEETKCKPKRHPYDDDTIDGKNVGIWFKGIKLKIKSDNDELYKKLAKRDCIVKALHDSLVRRGLKKK
jgi:superfamily II DNA or RNA helicase